MAEIVLLGLTVVAFMVGGGMYQSWQKGRRERLRVLEEALRNPEIDGETKRTIVNQLQAGGLPKLGSNAMFGIGWLGFFLGIGLLITDQRDLFEAGAIVSTLGFALITLPLAYREIEQRRRA